MLIIFVVNIVVLGARDLKTDLSSSFAQVGFILILSSKFYQTDFIKQILVNRFHQKIL